MVAGPRAIADSVAIPRDSGAIPAISRWVAQTKDQGYFRVTEPFDPRKERLLNWGFGVFPRKPPNRHPGTT